MNIAILGSGGHAFDISQELDFLGIPYSYLDPYSDRKFLSGKPIYSEDTFGATHHLLGVGYFSLNRVLFHEKYSEKPFFTLNTGLSKSGVTLSDGVILFRNSIVESDTFIGKHTTLHHNSFVGHDTKIGNNCFLAPHSVVSSRVILGNNCFIGLNSTVLDGVCLADNVVIGAGSLVTKSIHKSGTYVGNPLRSL